MTAAPRDPDAPEIRAWALENGYDLKPHGRIPAEARSAWASSNAGYRGPAEPPGPNGHDGGGGAITFEIPDFMPPDGPESDADGTEPPERAPQQPPRRSRREQLTERFRRRPAPARAGRRRRVTLETLGGLVWAGAAQLITRGQGGRFLPVANVMAFQSPVAGLVLEDTLKNTIADTALQPIARLVESGSTAGALVGPPALVALVCARPELYPVARPLLAASIKEWIIVAGPKLRELRRREEKFQAEMAELGEEFDMDIDQMIDQIFAPLMEQPGPDAMRSQPGPETASANGHQ